MTRYPLSVILLATVLPTASHAQDFCAVLNAALTQVTEARDAAIQASDAVSGLRFRLSEDRRLYGDDIQALARPSDGAATATNQLTTAVRDITDLRDDRCPSIPDGR